MKNFLKICSVGLLLGMSAGVQAQDIHFSQFYENAIMRNPALTGIFSGDFKVGVDYRNQWGNIASPFSTFAATAETRIAVNKSVGDFFSFGLGAFYDKAGSVGLSTQEVFPAIAYNKAINDLHNTYLSVGFTAGYIHRNVDMSKMTFSSQYLTGTGYSSYNASGENATFKSLSAFDLGAGVSINSSIGQDNKANYYAGVSLFHINRPTEIFNGGYSTVKLPMKWQINAGINFVMSERFSLALHGNSSSQGAYRETLLGGLLTFHGVTPGLPSIFAFSFGGFYRLDDAYIPTIKIDYSNVSLGVSYDVNSSSLATGGNSTSATELTLYVRSKYTHKNNPRDGVMCPRFESEIYSPFE